MTQVHSLRNALSKVSGEQLHERLRVGLRDAWSASTRAEAEGRCAQLIQALRADAPRLADWLTDTQPETLGCYARPR